MYFSTLKNINYQTKYFISETRRIVQIHSIANEQILKCITF